MKLSRISFLFLLLFLFVPSVSFAQSAAEKSWKPFWTQFNAAVKSKNKAAIKRLMSSEKDFRCGLDDTTRDEWLKGLDDNKWLGEVQRSVVKSTKPYDNGTRRPARITKDEWLIFEYIGGKWRFVGEEFLGE